jgi:hypothetical protein
MRMMKVMKAMKGIHELMRDLSKSDKKKSGNGITNWSGLAKIGQDGLRQVISRSFIIS